MIEDEDLAQEKVEAILSTLYNIEFAMFGYYAAIVDYMDTFQGNYSRKGFWEMTAGSLMDRFHMDGKHAVTYDTIKSTYYRIKKLKQDNDLTWEYAIMYYAWGGDYKRFEHPIRQGSPQYRKRKAIRVSLADAINLSDACRRSGRNVKQDRGHRSKLKELSKLAMQGLGDNVVFKR